MCSILPSLKVWPTYFLNKGAFETYLIADSVMLSVLKLRINAVQCNQSALRDIHVWFSENIAMVFTGGKEKMPPFLTNLLL